VGWPARRLLAVWRGSLSLRRLARGLRTGLSVLWYRCRALAVRGGLPPRVVARPPRGSTAPLPHPAIAVAPTPEVEDAVVQAFLEGQTETSVATEPENSGAAAYCWAPGDGLEALPATHLESLLLAAAAEDLSWVAGGWAAPAAGRHGPSGAVFGPPGAARASMSLARLPTGDGRRPSVLGRTITHVTDPSAIGEMQPTRHPFAAPAGPYLLSPDVRCGSAVVRRVARVDQALSALPPVAGPPTALFLLPFLAVGGAERLLFDLMEGLRARYRLLVVTVEPHRRSLGQTVDRARELTPHVYTLGDWLPREALPGAVRHLLRRWSVASLVSWNGTTFFYDEAPALRRELPHLRILNQLFNHRGGWIEHYSPRLATATDVHLAVNGPIAEALRGERGVPADRVVTIHHGVEVPPALGSDEREQLRRRARRSLGLPDGTTLVGSFIRMHPQKRPMDIVRLARRMERQPVHFLLVGGGPLDSELDRELAARPVSNLTRLPMQADTSSLFDALDLCLMTSSFEGLPVFLLEGLARGIPCVATAVGDIPLLLGDGGGVIVDRPGDLVALQSGIERLLDAGVRAREGDAGRATVERRFGLERYVREYEAVIFPGGHP